MKAFIKSQFGYCPLVWIFHGNRTLHNTMNGIQERVLMLIIIPVMMSCWKKMALIESITEIYNGWQQKSISSNTI